MISDIGLISVLIFVLNRSFYFVLEKCHQKEVVQVRNRNREAATFVELRLGGWAVSLPYGYAI